MKLSKIMGSLIIAGCALSGTFAEAAGLNAAQTKQVQDIVHNYISQNPEAIIQSLQSYQQKQMAQSVEKTQSTSLTHVDDIFRQSNDPVGGNPNGKISVVEFFDYQCGHCIGMQPVFVDLMKNPDVKVIFKEFPIRGPVSEIAAKAALAANLQGKYIDFHDALMNAASKAPLTEDIIYSTAGSVGLDMDKLKAAIKSDAISKQIKSNYDLAKALELMGTPAIFVASSDVNKKSPASAIVFIPGETDATHLNEVITQVSK